MGTSLILLFLNNEICSSIRDVFVKHLKKVDLSYVFYCTSVNGASGCLCSEIKKLVTDCQNLVSFKLKNNVHKNEILNCNRNMSLIYRTICNSNYNIVVLKITAEFLCDGDVEFTKHLCNLQTLHLYSARCITSLDSFKCMKHLSSFVITENILISPSAWKEFFTQPEMILIKRLGFDECLIDDSVSKTCKELRKLSLSGCRNDECELTNASVLAVFTSCKKLETVNMNYVDRNLQTAVNLSPKNIKNISFIPIN